MKAALTFSLIILSHSIFAATYEVPVDAALKNYAQFDLPSFEKIEANNTVTVNYLMPNILTGTAEKISLSGNAGYAPGVPFVLTGDKGMATCTTVNAQTSCKVEYGNLKIDQDAATAAIKAISKNGLEANKRIQVMKAFSSDPVGIVHY